MHTVNYLHVKYLHTREINIDNSYSFYTQQNSILWISKLILYYYSNNKITSTQIYSSKKYVI